MTASGGEGTAGGKRPGTVINGGGGEPTVADRGGGTIRGRGGGEATSVGGGGGKTMPTGRPDRGLARQTAMPVTPCFLGRSFCFPKAYHINVNRSLQMLGAFHLRTLTGKLCYTCLQYSKS